MLKRKVTRRVYDAGLRHGTSSSNTVTNASHRPPLLAASETLDEEVVPPKATPSDPPEYSDRLTQGLRFEE